MKTIQAELETAVLGPEYAHVVGRRPTAERVVKKVYEWYCRLLFTVYCPLKVEGRERLPRSSFIFCSNHNSHMDSVILMLTANRGFNKFGMMAARDYFFENPLRKYFLNLFMNLVPVERKRNDRRAMIEGLVACRDFMRTGDRSLIIYPEGTRSLTGKIGPFKKGPAMMATELGLPVVPAYIKGSHRAWPKGRNVIRPARVYCWVGEPIHPEKFRESAGDGGSNREGANFGVYKQVTAALERSIRDMEKQHGGNYE